MPQEQERVRISDPRLTHNAHTEQALPQERVRISDPTGPCGVVLAAGAGVRLRPLTLTRPKPLCPVNNVALLDHALTRIRTATSAVAVNVHYGWELIATHLDSGGRSTVHLSVEEPEALGTAGAVGRLRDWADGRDVVVLNGDTWCPGSLGDVVATWDRERVRLLVAGSDELEPTSRVAGVLIPWNHAATLQPVPSGLYEVLLGPLAGRGTLDVARWDGPCIDCGTPASYLEANLTASGGRTVIGDGAKINGTAERSVVWDGAEVHRAEHLVDAIRTDTRRTVLVR